MNPQLSRKEKNSPQNEVKEQSFSSKSNSGDTQLSRKEKIKEISHQMYLCGMNNIPDRLFDEYFERNYKWIFEGVKQ